MLRQAWLRYGHPEQIISESIHLDFGFTPTFDCNYFQIHFGMKAN